MYDFDEIIPVSALRGHNLDDVVDTIFKYLPYGPMFYDEDTVTDQPERQIVSEIIREKALQKLDKEVPHGLAVEIERWEEREDGLFEINAAIYCERKSHKGIIIGKHGAMLKEIGAVARYEIQRLLGGKVYLELWVKVKENWRNNPNQIRNFGYEDLK